jgi:hypothetical protein
MRTSIAIVLVVLLTASAGSAASGALSPDDRSAINATLDVFVPAAVARIHPERAWELATPAMHVGGTRAVWPRGELPIPPFPGAGKTFHDWTVDAVSAGAAQLVMLLHPRRGARVGAISFDIAMRKVKGEWLVDSFVPAAFFAPAGERSGITAAADFAPSPNVGASAARGRISGSWLLVLLAGLAGLIVLVPTALFTVHRVRDRRAAKRYA